MNMVSRKEQSKCVDCGEITPLTPNGFSRKRCPDCQEKARHIASARYNATAKSKRPKIFIDLVCEECGNIFHYQVKGARPRFCANCRSGSIDKDGKKIPPQFVIDRSRRHHFKKMYNITLSDREDMLKKQEGLCAICKVKETKKEFLQIDHDHSCCEGASSCGSCIRGLICARCNKALGMLRDDPIVAKRLVTYRLKKKRLILK